MSQEGGKTLPKPYEEEGGTWHISETKEDQSGWSPGRQKREAGSISRGWTM